MTQINSAARKVDTRPAAASAACFQPKPQFFAMAWHNLHSAGAAFASILVPGREDVMRYGFKAGDRVRLSNPGRRLATKAFRTGVVVAPSRSGTQCRVQWEDVMWPQLIHADLLELATTDSPVIAD